MDVAALAISIDSSEVVKAASDLDRFSAASAKAGTSAKAPASGAAAMAQDMARSAASAGAAASSLGGFSNSASRAAAAAQSAAKASAAASSSVIDYGRGIDLLTGKVNNNLVAINRSIAAWGQHKKALNDNAGAIQASTSNIAAQFQDIGVTAAMGMNPLLIALQQGTQLSAAFAGGGLKSLGSALASVISPTSLLTIAIVAGVAALIQWGMEAFKSADSADKLSKAIEQTKLSTYAFGDAQTALGGVIDLTTGKIKSQSAALYGLARAQLEMIRATALRDRAEATKTIGQQRGLNTPTLSGAPGSAGPMSLTGLGLSGQSSANQTQSLLDRFTSGKITPTQAIDGLEKLKKTAGLTEDAFIKLIGAIANYGVAGENLKVYQDARKALEGDTGALQQFLTPNKPRKGGKTDAEKLADIYAGATADIATEKARGLAEANSLGALETAKLEKQTSLLNAVQQRNIPITEAVRAKVADLADQYAKAKVDADISKVVNDTTDGIQRQRDAVAEQTKLIGLYGDALARARREMDAEKALRESLPKGEIFVTGNLTGGLSDDIEASDRAARMEKVRRDAELSAYAMDLERKGLGLTGAAAESYAFVTERLNEAKRAGIDLSPAEVAAIKAAGDAYGSTRHAIDQQAQAIADAREVTKGFFTDWLGGVREGANVFKAFTDSVLNGLNRIIDKLLDRTLDNFLDGMFKNGSGNSSGGGFLNAILSGLGNSSSSEGTKAALSSFKGGFAYGGAFDQVRRFANGGMFTNQVFSQPTLFRFANGAAIGEMGEAGPEAVMPLKRGPNGKLGVQAHGGSGRGRTGDVKIENNFQFAGAVGLDGMIALVRQGSEATMEQVRRELQSMLAQLDADGAFAS